MTARADAVGAVIADAADQRGALQGGEVGVGEVKGGVAFDDRDAGVAKQASDFKVALDDAKVEGGSDGEGEFDVRRDAAGSVDVEFDARR